MSDLEKFYRGQLAKRPLFGGHRLSSEARAVHDEVILTGLKMQGVQELTDHAMNKAVNMDQARKDKAGNDEVLNAILADLEVGGVSKLKQLQSELYNPFKR